MAEKDIDAMARRIEALLDRDFGTGKRGLAAALDKAGRRLPRRMRKAGRMVADADFMAGHPKLVWQIDRKRVGRAAERLAEYLESVDPKARRIDMTLSILRSLAVNLLLLAGILLALAYWRGGL